MKKLLPLFQGRAMIMLLGVLFILLQGSWNTAFGQAYTSGNVVVYRVGTGSAALSSAAAPVFLDEYNTTTGAKVASHAMPTATGVSPTPYPLTATGTTAAEGRLSLSSDGLYLIVPGYSCIPGSTNPAFSNSDTTFRVIGVISASGTVNTTTALNMDSSFSIISACSPDGVNLYSTTNGLPAGSFTKGLVNYTTLGSTGRSFTTVSGFTSSADAISPDVSFGALGSSFGAGTVQIFGGQLYVGAPAEFGISVGTVGTGLPTTTGGTTQNVTELPGLPYEVGSTFQDFSGFYFADINPSVDGPDVLYLESFSPKQLFKFSLPTTGGTWVQNGPILTFSTAQGSPYGITGSIAGSAVTLYVTTSGGSTGSGSFLYKLVDNNGWNAAPSYTTVPTALATAGTNEAFRGVAFAPRTSGTATNLQIISINEDHSPTSGTPFQLTVQSQDISGNPATVSSATTINLSVASGLGTITGTGVIPNGGDQVTITATYSNAGNIAEAGVSFTATPTSGPLAAGTSGFIDVLGKATTLTFGTVPSTGTINSPLTSFTVVATAGLGGVIDSNYTGTVTLAQASGPGTTSGTLSIAAQSGVATFINVQMNATGSYTLSAAATGLTGATSSSVTIQSASLAFVTTGTTGFPATGVINSPIVGSGGASFTVTALINGINKKDSTFVGPVTISIASGAGSALGTLTVNAVAGIATFTNVKVNTIGTYTLTASSTGFTSATSPSIAIAGAAVYKWNVASGSWATATSWIPNRSTAKTSDVLVFDGSIVASPVVTFPATATIGSLSFINGVSAQINTTTSSVTLNVNGGVGQVFTVALGCSLKVFNNTSPAPATATGLTISIASGLTGLVDGVITFDGVATSAVPPGGSGAHSITAASAGALVFANGSYMIAGQYASGSPFGTTGAANTVVFNSGSRYVYKGGANPFGLSAPSSKVNFQSGSTFENAVSYLTSIAIPSLSGRTYPNYVVSAPYQSTTGFSSNVTFANFTVNPGVVYKFLPSGNSSGNYVINGTLDIAGGDTVQFGGSNNGNATPNFMTGALVLNGTNNVISNPQSTGGVYIQNLTLASGTSTTVPTNTVLTVNGTLTNSGTLTLQDNSSLVQGTGAIATGSGKYIVEQPGSILPGLSGYNMWSSPIAASGFNFGWDDVNIYEYVETGAVRTASDYTTGWVSPFTAPAPYNTSTMLVGQGYILTGALNNAAFNGPNINNGNYSVPVTLTDINNSNKDGWNLLGNPYPSDIALTGANGFLSNLTNSLLISGGTVYFWSSSEGNYVATNGVTPGATTIPSCQGFFIEAVGNGSSIQFNNAMRQPSATSFYRQGADAVALLRITNPNGKTDATQIEFREGACDCYVKTEDAYKLKGNDTLEFYSKITTGNPYDFAINLLAPLELSKTVKLGYDAIVAGQYSIAIKDTVGFNGVSVYLLDNLLGSTYDLTKGSYQFTSGAVTEDTARFAVVFAPQSASVSGVTGVSSSTVSSTVNIYAYNKVVYVQNSVPTNVSISDITGRNVYQGNSTEINMSSATTGIYVVSVVNGNGVTTQKVVIQ